MKTYYLKILVILLTVSYSTELLFSQDISFRKSFLMGGEIGISKPADATPERNKILYYNNSFGLGYALFLNRNISIEPILTYSLDYISVNTGGIKYVLEQNIFLLVSLQVYLNFGSNESTF
jgi:hypothetical protein